MKSPIKNYIGILTDDRIADKVESPKEIIFYDGFSSRIKLLKEFYICNRSFMKYFVGIFFSFLVVFS